MSQVYHIKVGRRAREDENLPHNWENIDINTFRIPKDKKEKVVFMLGGNTTNREESNNGNAKVVTTSLSPENSAETKVYSFMYETEPIEKFGACLSERYIEDVKVLYENTFKPILFDNKGQMKEKKSIEQEFNRMVFVSHCGGSCFVDIIIEEFYNTLLKKYHPNTAELLIGKIKYISYAPHELPRHNVNAFFITPYIDVNYSWVNALENAEQDKVDVDFPRGIINKLLNARKKGIFQSVFENEFKSTRAIMFKIGNITYFIPNQINPDKIIGDHSIECITKSKFLNSDTDCGINAKITNSAFRTYLNSFLNNPVVDLKAIFSKIARGVERCNPNSNQGYTISKK